MMMPFGPPVVETLVSVMLSPVVPPSGRVISTAAAPLVTRVPLVAVMLLLLFVDSNAFWFAFGEILRLPNVMVPSLFTRLTPVPPDVDTEVFAKFRLAAELLTSIPIPLEPVTVVEPVVKLPATPDRKRPVVALPAEEMLANVPLRVPVVRFRVRPLPFRVTSKTFNVPKPLPLMSPVELPPVNPRSVLF